MSPVMLIRITFTVCMYSGNIFSHLASAPICQQLLSVLLAVPLGRYTNHSPGFFVVVVLGFLKNFFLVRGVAISLFFFIFDIRPGVNCKFQVSSRTTVYHEEEKAACKVVLCIPSHKLSVSSSYL